MKEAFTFDDVLIVPKFSSIASREDVDLNYSGLSFPVISSNMDTVTGVTMASEMLRYGAQACLHRFCSIEDNVKMFKDSQVLDVFAEAAPMVSIGLGDEGLERARALYSAGADIFVIDVAHGAQGAVARQAIALRGIIGSNGNIIVGNFASGESVKDFLHASGRIIDGVKVGIGPGSACTTRIKTGVGYPQLSAVLDISRSLKNTGISIIADGGMKTPGDIAKALGAGAHVVMLGGMLAGTDETPGETIERQDGPIALGVQSWSYYKKYRGSASKESYEAQGKTGTHRTSEGESFTVACKGPVKGILRDIEGGLKSAFSYVGACNLKEFHANVEFVRITNAGYIEGTPHGKK